MPEWLREFAPDVLAPVADVPEHVVAELAQLLPRTGAPAPLPDGGDDQPDRRQWRNMPIPGATRRMRDRHVQCANRVDLCRKAG